MQGRDNYMPGIVTQEEEYLGADIATEKPLAGAEAVKFQAFLFL